MLFEFLLLALLFLALFFICRLIDNYGFVDVAWAAAFSVLALLWFAQSTAWLPRRLTMLIMPCAWSLRLTLHLARRVLSHHPQEDGRYVQLRRDWAAAFAPKMCGFFQLQALSVLLLALPFYYPTLNTAAAFHPAELTGMALWLVAFFGEAVADHQLAAFKRDPANRGKVCDRGLWAYSRHPNYFGEWLIWVSLAVFALGSNHGAWAVLSPAVILFLILRVTGIPLTEEQALRSKGDAYRRYQATTNRFVPGPRRSLPH